MFKAGQPQLIASWFRRRRIFSLVVMWTMFIALIVGYALLFDEMNRSHDIQDAVQGAVTGLDNGLNPYVEPVVPRFHARGADGNYSFDNGTYNYLPLDLLVYSGMHHLLGAAGYPGWFVAANLIFASIAFALFRDLAPLKLEYYVPFAGMVSIYFSLDNSSLTLLLMVLSVMSLRQLGSRYGPAVSVMIMGLAVLTKAYAVVPYAVLVIWLVQRELRDNHLKDVGRVLAGVAGSVAIGVLLVLPFGFTNVLDSAVFFHLSEASRHGTMTGGTLLAELAKTSPYYGYIAVGAVSVAIAASLRLKDLYDRIVFVSCVFLMVVVNSSPSLVLLPGIFLAFRFVEWARPTRSETKTVAPRVLGAPSRKIPEGEDAA